MKMKTLVDRYHGQIHGVLSCYDRVLLQGQLASVCYPDGMAIFLATHGLSPSNYFDFVKPFGDAIRANCERVATEAGCRIEYINSHHCRKEDRVAKVLARRGDHPGLVHVLSAMETCSTFHVRRDKTGVNVLRSGTGRCLHYYFYFIDAELGLCFLRVPTWAPYRLTFYFNGHNQLACKLRKAKIKYEMLDNAFVNVDDFPAAQRFAKDLDVDQLIAKLQHYAQMYCPPASQFGDYRWTIQQAEYSTDIIFKRQADFQPLYASLTRTAIHAVKPDDVATFLGRKLTSKYQGVVGNDFSTRIEGTRIKHYMGRASIKMYDKAGIILRIETTVNDVSFLRTRRIVQQKDGKRVFRVAALRKYIYTLREHLMELLAGANRRYLEFLSALDDLTAGKKSLRKISSRVVRGGRGYRGINFFLSEDANLLHVLSRGELAISGFRNKNLRQLLPNTTPAWISRCLKRLKVHGLLRGVTGTYKYLLTALGKRVVASGLALRELTVVPVLSGQVLGGDA